MSEHVTPLTEPATGSSATGWVRHLAPRERRALAACWGGWALDGMDFQMYPFVIPTLMLAWHITGPQAGSLGTAVLLMSSLGGWIAGYMADRVGRVRTLQITIAWFALFSLLSGLAQSYEQFFAARALLGLGFGGEYAVGAVLLGETIRADRRGRTLGVMASASAAGWAVAALLYTVLFSVLPEQTAWRALFIAGTAPALAVVFLRRFISEPDIYQRSRALAGPGVAQAGPFEIFRPKLLATTVACSLLATGAQGGFFAITTWLPTYLGRVRGFSVASTGGYVGITVLGSFLGYLAGAYLSDRIGRRGTFLTFACGAFAIVLVYTLVPLSNAVLLPLGLPLGFFASGVFSATPAFFNEVYPTRCRALGLGFVHNFGRGIGAVFPFLVGLLTARLGLAAAIGTFAAGAYGLVFVIALIVPETKGRELSL